MNTTTRGDQYQKFLEKRQTLLSLIQQQTEVLRALNMAAWATKV